MFLSRKLEAFMAVVENGSLSKAARVMNRTTPPVAKSIKDFESIIGKKLFKREKFGMSLTRDGEVLYNDLKDLYQQEKEITKNISQVTFPISSTFITTGEKVKN